MKNLNKTIFIIIIVICFTKNIIAKDNISENKILFSLDDEIFTTIDLNNRNKYINIKENKIINKDVGILEDYISVILFNKYFDDLKINNNINTLVINKLNDIINNLKLNQNNDIIKIYDNIDINILKKNISYDLKRKIIIENKLREQSELIFNNNINEFNNIYEIFIKLISINNVYEINNEKSFDEIIKDLNSKDINYIIKEKKLNFTEQINKKIKIAIINNSENFIIKNIDNTVYGEIIRKIKDPESIKFSLIQIETKNKLTKNNLICKNINKLDTNENKIIENQNILYSKLNKTIKNNLIKINDHINIINGGINTYIILCDIYYEDKIFENINTNNKINFLAKKIEDDLKKLLIKKYKFKYI